MINKVIILVVGAAILIAGFFYQEQLDEWGNRLATQVNEELPGLEEVVYNLTEQIDELTVFEGQVQMPGPLRSLLNNPEAFMTVSGAITETNERRNLAGLTLLKESELLNKAAQEKLSDMFVQEYFEHVSPDGVSPGELIESIGYEYIEVGENLALGNYAGDTELVQAWMDSPPHRENILTSSYTQIGMAVGQGMFEGQLTWLAVQEFGRPLSLCPEVDKFLSIGINSSQKELDDLGVAVDLLKQELKETKPTRRVTSEKAVIYNEKIDSYNSIVRQYNNLSDELQKQVDDYNIQVRAFNACLKGT